MDINSIGFMQGRLSPLYDGRIQSFPWNHWQSEFRDASSIEISLIEWTLDQERLYENPLMTKKGVREIRSLMQKFNITIPSLTGDCFMQSPFWKLFGNQSRERKEDFISIVSACNQIGIRDIVVPLVDGGSIENADQSNALLDFLHDQASFLERNNIRIIFESDYHPQDLSTFINQFSSRTFGINYDIGNSASLGFNVSEEFAAYGDRIYNIHVKDRILNSSTVPLGAGNADFAEVFKQLRKINYSGNYILQTARAINGNHLDLISSYRYLVYEWYLAYGA